MRWNLLPLGALLVIVVCAGCASKPKSSNPGGFSNPAAVAGSGAGSAGSTGGTAIGGSAGSNVIGAGSSGGSGTPTCTGLQCQVDRCISGTTSISGKIYDPAGKNPLYNVVVYVPNEAVQPLKSGASCDMCKDLYSGKPIAVALTDAAGAFTIKGAPSGANIPLVIQVGRWRMQTRVANVTKCQDNPQPDKSLRLPRNHTEGDIPNIAISTGSADTLECLLARIGVDKAEYTPGTGAGRIHIFQGAGPIGANGPSPNTSPAAPMSAAALWNDVASLMPYDIVLLSCEGAETTVTLATEQAMHDYAAAGGRVFASHYHYAFFTTGPYSTDNLANWSPGGADLGTVFGDIVTQLPSGATFPKGVAMKQWLTNVNALTNGRLPIQQARQNAVVTAANKPSQPWIVIAPGSAASGATEYFSFNTPVNALPKPDGTQYCGRVVFSDLHVGAASGDMPLMPVPAECAVADLSPQEKALEFMLFDLSSCVSPDDRPPAPPLLQ
jgi:hypothetical protein